MEIAIRSFILLILIFTFAITLLDINKNQTMKQTMFETIRAANQNGLLALQEDYDNFEVLSTGEMLNEWLFAFINNNSLEYKDITIGFVRIESEPPFYIVTFEGCLNNYAIVTSDAYVEYTNAAMLVTENEKSDNE